ncbi:Alpha kinase [Phytophthora nicotianae]|uniref:Alpha kinase n=2 Tax=Phytophthora nicotianae TaxID=4792 RepID=A0A0W8DRG6_PHYNI|nr:Alpha kinase [Phytophthora nicotianae]
MIFSYGKGYCYRHARDQGIEVNRTSKAIARYRPQVSEGDANGIEADERRPQNFEKARQDFDETSSSTSTATCKPHHVTCKAFRCMKWVMRVGEYCSIHRASRGSKHDNSRTSTPDLATSILQEHKMKSTDASTVGLIKWKGSSDNTTRCRGVPR